MAFDTFLQQAWEEHGDDPARVAERLHGAGAGLVVTEAQLVDLSRLSHHLLGEHLGRWADGVHAQQQLALLPPYDAEGPSGHALRRCIASLRLCAGDTGTLEPLGRSDRVRVGAMAAAALARSDTARAAELLEEAFDGCAALPADDPGVRSIAISGNNLALALEEATDRSPAQRALMIRAAEVARRCWGIAGGWLEVERAEYRLAMTWLQAGDPAQARRHAESCLALVEANGAASLEHHFAWEAVARAAAAQGDGAGFRLATERARQAFERLDDGDQAWCREGLERLARLERR